MPASHAGDRGSIPLGSTTSSSGDMNTLSAKLRFAALAMTLCGCGSSSDDAASSDASATPFQGSVTYALDLNHGGTIAEDGDGWSAVNELGVRFDVHRGGVVLQNLQLTTCDPNHRGHQHGRWIRWLGVQDAYAGHGAPEDPSAVSIPRYLRVAGSSAESLSATTTADGLYCGVHVLIGRLLGEVQGGVAPPPELQGHSLWLEGTWRLPDTETDIAFRMQATEAFGVRTELFEDMPTHLDHGFASVTLTGQGDRSAWFKGVHPQKMDQRAVRRLVLRNVVESIQWSGAPVAKSTTVGALKP